MVVRLPLDEPISAAPGVPLDTVEAALTRGFALEIAPPWIVERGVGYAEAGRVHGLEVGALEVHATVEGSQPYEVHLRREEDEVLASCSCPMGATEDACKHLVAVALAVAERTAPAPFTARDTDAAETGDESGEVEVRAWLLGRPVEELADLLLDHADHDHRLARRLRLLASHPAIGIDLEGYRAAIDEAVSVSPYGYVDWDEAFEWSRGVDEVLEAVEELLGTGYAEAVVELTERTLQRLADAAPSIDGSAGVLDAAAARAQALHLAACDQARPDPGALAERLLCWQLEHELELVDDAIATYREVLGEEGVATYRRLLEARWAAVAPAGPGDDPVNSAHRWRLERLMRQLVEAGGDLDDLTELLRRDLSHPHRFTQLADACAGGGRADDAIGWLREGLRHFPDADALSDRLSDLLVAADDAAAALEVELDAFRARPTLQRYRRLRPPAQTLGRWEEVRETALRIAAELEADARPADPAVAEAFAGRSWMPRIDRSLTVSMLLWEGRSDEAWEAATEGGCSDELWRRLADARARTHPHDALAVRRRELKQTLGPAERGAYDRVAEVLLAMRPSFDQLHDRAGFDRLVDEVCRSHRRRRLLLERLDRAGLRGAGEGP